MKPKKFLCAILALLCSMTMTTPLTSCSSNDDDQYVIYEAKSTNVSNIFIAQIAAFMNNAIDKEFGSTDGVRVVLRNDWKAIEVCDEVAKEFIIYDLIDSIELTVTPISSDSDDNPSDSEVIKTYHFTSDNTSSSTDSTTNNTDNSENSENSEE